MAIGALSKVLSKAIVSATDDLFDETKVAEKIRENAEAIEAELFFSPDVDDVGSPELQDYMTQYIQNYAKTGNTRRMSPELEKVHLIYDFDHAIANRLEKMIDADLQGSTYNVYRSQFNPVDEAEDYDPDTDRAIYNYLASRLNKAENNNLLSEAGREKVLTRAIATLKGMPEYKNLRESMPNFDDLSTQMEKLPAPIANREKALEDFLADSVEKRPQYRGVSSLHDTEWDARFWMTNEIGPHVGTQGQANYFALQALTDQHTFSPHMGTYTMGIEANQLGETFERAGVYIKPEDFNRIYDNTIKINSYLDEYIRDLELDPNDLKSYTKLSIEGEGQIDDFVPEPEEFVHKDVQGNVMFRSRGKQPLTGWEEIIEAVGTQVVGLERFPLHEVKAVSKMLGQIRGWGDNVYGSNVRPATIQKGYVNVKNPLKIGNDGVWKIEGLFSNDVGLEETIWDNGGVDMFLDAMAVQLNTTRESIAGSIPFKKLNEKANMISEIARDYDITSYPQFEATQAMSLEIANLHQEFRKFLESYGFDSIQYINQVEPSFTTDADNFSYILFRPEQWKAIGARRFDPNDKRFGAAKGGVIGFFSRLLSDQDEVERPTSRVVQRGDTLEKVSRETGISVDDLQKFNNIEDPNRIQVGQTLRFEPPVEKNQVVSNLASYLNPFASDKTEKDYDTKVVGELKKAAKNAVAAGRMNIEYQDYRGANVRGQASSPEQRKKDNFVSRTLLGQMNPTEEAAFSVGGAQLVVENGNVFATDIYDFSEIPFDKVKDIYSGARYLAGKIPGREFKSKILLGTAEEFGLRQQRMEGGITRRFAVAKGGLPKDMYRRDGSIKSAQGFLGPVKNLETGKTMTELSIDIPIDGKEVQIPTMVPTLTAEEIKILQSQNWEGKAKDLPRSIVRKAVDHAIKRMDAGLNPFYQDDEGREGKAKGGKIDKKKMKCNKPRRTPSHPKKSHVVKACEGGKEKIIRFGEQGAKTAGKPKAGESKRMKAKRKSFKARHRKNIKRGKMSAAYWADKVKW